MVRYALIAVIVLTALTIYALIDCARTPEAKMRSLPKWSWLVIIIFVVGIGPIAWIIAGRPEGPSGGRRKKGKIVPPDDNPDFLRKL